MNEEFKEKLKQSGVDVDDGVARFMGNDLLYEKFLVKFLEDGSMAQLNEQFRSGNLEGAFRAAHTLKGVTGNLSLKELFEKSAPIVETLRKGSAEGVEEGLEELNRCYDRLCRVIREGLE